MTALDPTAAQLREARDRIDSLQAENARLRGALQEAIAVAEQLSQASPGNAYYRLETLPRLRALAQIVTELGADSGKAAE